MSMPPGGGAHPQHDHDDGHDHRHAGGVRGLVGSVLGGHHHDPAGSVDEALASSREGIRALTVSLAALGVTAAVQLAVVAASGSVALLSDTVHNAADALTAVPLGLAFWLARRPANSRYTYGYGRSEDLAGIFVVATIAASCALAGWEAISRLSHPHPVHQLPWVIAAGAAGVAGNELVARYRVGVGRRIGSAALVADGLHARADGWSSLAVVAGALGSFAGWPLADPIAGLAITLTILLVVQHAARDIYRRLMDAVDPRLVTEVTDVLSRVEGIDRVDTVRIRWVGHELRAEAEVTSDAGLTLAEAHAVGERAHHTLLHDVPRLRRATIHTSPTATGGIDPHGLTAHHFLH